MVGASRARNVELKEEFVGPIISRSTLWARANPDSLHQSYLKKKGTLKGKLTNLVTQSKYRASKAGLGHEMDVAILTEMYEKQRGRCALSGIEMTIVGSRGSDEYWRSISIDRIDSTKGYILGNVQLVCTGVNYMKKDMTDELFIHFCRTVTENQDGTYDTAGLSTRHN